MWALRNPILILVSCLVCGGMAACAGLVAKDKAPQEVWERLARGEAQDLLVEFDDAAIGAERYAGLKRAALSALPSGTLEVLKDYDALPLMYLRFRTTQALKSLLAQPSIVRVYVDRKEAPMPGRPER